MFWFILFSASLNADIGAFEPKLVLGSFPSIELCAAAGAIGINDLNALHPDKDFRGECSQQNEIRRHPDEPLYDLQQLAALAGARR